MRSGLVSLCAAVSIALSSFGADTNGLNDSLIANSNSIPKYTNGIKTVEGKREYAFNEGYRINVTATQLLDNGSDKKPEKNLEFVLTDSKDDVSITLFDKGSNGLSPGDYVSLNYKMESGEWFKVKVDTLNTNRFRAKIKARVYLKDEIISEYEFDTNDKFRPILGFIPNPLRPIATDKIEKAAGTFSSEYIKFVGDISEGREPRIPYTPLVVALKDADSKQKGLNRKERAQKTVSFAISSISRSLSETNKVSKEVLAKN